MFSSKLYFLTYRIWWITVYSVEWGFYWSLPSLFADTRLALIWVSLIWLLVGSFTRLINVVDFFLAVLTKINNVNIFYLFCWCFCNKIKKKNNRWTEITKLNQNKIENTKIFLANSWTKKMWNGYQKDLICECTVVFKYFVLFVIIICVSNRTAGKRSLCQAVLPLYIVVFSFFFFIIQELYALLF